MDIIKQNIAIDFMGKRYITGIVSALAVMISVGSIMIQGFNFGIDFTGGTLIEVGYPQPVDIAKIRPALADNGFADAQVQYFGTSRDILIRIAPREGKNSTLLSEEVLTALRQQDPAVSMRRVEFVGPQVGKELTEQGSLAMLYALIGILIYIMLRFHIRFAPGAIIALIHDVLIIMGVFSLWQFDFDLTVLAALLAIIGYSLNDTIVVFDRIRENFRKMRKGTTIEIFNKSLNQTLSRTLMTSLTTLVVVAALFIFGGKVIHPFALALMLGIFVGTYSSIYVASSATLALGVSKKDLMQTRKEGANDAP